MLSYTDGRLARGAISTLYTAEQEKIERLQEENKNIDVFSVRAQMSTKELYEKTMASKGKLEEAISYYFQFTPLLLNKGSEKMREQHFLSVLYWAAKHNWIRTYGGEWWLTRTGKQVAEVIDEVPNA